AGYVENGNITQESQSGHKTQEMSYVPLFARGLKAPMSQAIFFPPAPMCGRYLKSRSLQEDGRQSRHGPSRRTHRELQCSLRNLPSVPFHLDRVEPGWTLIHGVSARRYVSFPFVRPTECHIKSYSIRCTPRSQTKALFTW